MGVKRPIEGEVVEAGEPAYYVPQMTRTRRLALWFFRSGAFQLVAVVLMGAAIVLWKITGLVAVICLTVGWYLGWFTAKLALRDEGEIPPL